MDRTPATDGPATDHTTLEYSCVVTVSPADHDDHPVVSVRGVLFSPREEGALRQVLLAQLLDRGRVVVDLSEATVPWGSPAQLFPTTLAEAGGWPLARLVLAGADPLTARILRAARVHLTVPLAATITEARLLLDARPPRVAAQHELPCAPAAPLLARLAVASVCEEWELDDGLHDGAATVATELVTNAVEHAGTACILEIALDRRCLQIAVRDRSPVAKGRPEITVTRNGGYGLLVVQGLSRGWGVTPHAHGKTVWALLDAEDDPRF